MSMKITGAVVIALAMVSAGCVKKMDVTASKTALQTADAAWSKSAAAGPDAFVGFLADGGTVMPPNEAAVSGAAAVKDWATKTMAMPGFGVAWAANVAEVAASGDVGYTSGTYDLHANLPNGSQFADHGKYLTVWKKDASGAWKVAYDIFNSDMPAPGAGGVMTPDTTVVH